MQRKLYEHIAARIQAIATCQNFGNTEWLPKHRAVIEWLIKNHMPSGGGFDGGTKFDFDKSHAERLVFLTAFHHMRNGLYDGWTEHAVIITPSLANGFMLRITGHNRNDIKGYVAECFQSALSEVYEDDCAPIIAAMDAA